MSAYPEKIWRLFREPRRQGCFDKEEAGTSTGKASTPASHAVLHVHLKLSDDRRIEDALFQALGCPSMIATGSWLCAWLLGRKADAVKSLQAETICEQLQLPALKRYCAVMAVEALNDALQKASKTTTDTPAQPASTPTAATTEEDS